MKIRDLLNILHQYDDELDVFIDYEGYELQVPDDFIHVNGTYHTTHDGDIPLNALVFYAG